VASGSLAHAANTLNCTLQNDAGAAAQETEVVLTLVSPGKDQGKEWKKKTNDDGKVEFKGLPDGTYRLQGAVDGYLLTKGDGIELSGNTTKTCNPVFVSVEQLNKLLTEAMEAARTSKFDVAVERAQAAVTLAPGIPQTHNMLAVAYARKGMAAEATASINKAVALDKTFENMVAPIQMEALGAQASDMLQKKDFDGAIKKYEEIAALMPNEPSVYYNMALAYGHKGDFDNAIKSIDKAIAMKPDDLEFKQRKVQLQDLYLKSTEKSLELK
jgi:tetratricopeptide (TPR) repeat protein